ncbi:MAG: hypothetical protein ACRC41_12320 [Sarcina sp.]
MKFKGKKKGSTLLIVVCFFSIIAIVIISVMSMVTTGFKLRKDENKRIESFYSADSGIEIAKNKILTFINDSVEKAYEHVQKLETEHMHDGCNNVDFTDERWKDIHFKEYFEKLIDNGLEEEIDNVDFSSVIYDEFAREGKIVKVDAIKGLRENGVQIWSLKSNFKDKDNKEREVAFNFNIETPSYGKKAGETVINDSIFDYIMGIDGNLDINNNGTFESLGDMWIGGGNQKGNREDVNYKPAINLYGNNGLEQVFHWQGNIVTPRDLLVNNVSLNAHNIYADDFLYRGAGDKLDIRDDLYVYNDFVFDGSKTTINMKNYYGLDEIDTKQSPSDEDIGQDPKNWGTASSIIVNSNDFGEEGKSKINISENMYVLGTAYLKLKEIDYKTGESVVINKFTEPYTNRRLVEAGVTEEKYLYDYINPLHIVDKMWDGKEYKNLSIVDKVEIINRYFEENKDILKSPVFNGINVGGNTYTAGVSYNTDKKEKGVVQPNADYPVCSIKEHSHGVSQRNMVECSRKDFVEQAYNMGNTLSYTESELEFKRKNIVASVDKSFNWKFIRDNLMIKESLTHKDSGEEIFKRKSAYPDNGKVKDAVWFESTKTVKDILGDKVEGATSILGGAKINILFNVSERDKSGNKIGEAKKIIFSEYTNELKEEKGNLLVPANLVESNANITVVISDGDILVDQNNISKNSEVRGMFYTTEDLDLDISGVMRFGNHAVPEFEQLNYIFKELFVGVIGGVVDGGGIIDQGNGEEVVNPSDILREVKWELIK